MLWGSWRWSCPLPPSGVESQQQGETGSGVHLPCDPLLWGRGGIRPSPCLLSLLLLKSGVFPSCGWGTGGQNATTSVPYGANSQPHNPSPWSLSGLLTLGAFPTARHTDPLSCPPLLLPREVGSLWPPFHEAGSLPSPLGFFLSCLHPLFLSSALPYSLPPSLLFPRPSLLLLPWASSFPLFGFALHFLWLSLALSPVSFPDLLPSLYNLAP